jgi:hypothetical protein
MTMSRRGLLFGTAAVAAGGVGVRAHWRGAGTPEASTRQCWTAISRKLRDAGAL